jgi:hypothetical protein
VLTPLRYRSIQKSPNSMRTFQNSTKPSHTIYALLRYVEWTVCLKRIAMARDSTDRHCPERPPSDYARAALSVAEHYLNTSIGDPRATGEYLAEVAGSNAEEAIQASEILKRLKTKVITMASSEGRQDQSVRSAPEDTSMGS